MDFDTREFRNTLGCFATGVTVITASPEGYEPLGITVNSFASVSLDPPLVLWSLDRDSDTFEAFKSANYYTVNILSESQQELSNRFAQRYYHHLDGLSYGTGEVGCPILPQTLAVIECGVHQRINGGDHLILIGKVLRFERKEGKPLLFAMGSYSKLAEEM